MSFANFDCNLNKNNYAEQLNLVTHFLDGSQIYGSSGNRSDSIRLGSNGLLRTSPGVKKDYLPLTFDKTQGLGDQCSLTNSSLNCFVAGETRTSENLGLSSMHTLFMREHNRIATILTSINPSWDDNRLFQETRKILIGMYQHIIYNEWLPATMGVPTTPDLVPTPLNTYFTGYDPTVNPSLANEFATATLRFGHSAVNRLNRRFDLNNNDLASPLLLGDTIFTVDEAYK